MRRKETYYNRIVTEKEKRRKEETKGNKSREKHLIFGNESKMNRVWLDEKRKNERGRKEGRKKGRKKQMNE